MARALRIQQAGAWYHVHARGIERRPIFRQDRDREHFLKLLERLSDRFACNLSAYGLMESHFHLFLQTTESNLSRAMQWLMSAYATWFNLRHQRSGHLFQGRYKAVVVQPDEWAVSLTRYLHLNPVRIKPLGLDKRAHRGAHQPGQSRPVKEIVRGRLKRLRAFRWSSYRTYAGYEKAPAWLKADWVLGRCGRTVAQQRRWYRDYCEGAVKQGEVESPRIVDQVCLGSHEFLERVLGSKGKKEGGSKRVGFHEVRSAIEQVRGERWQDFGERHGDWGRDLALYLMRNGSGQSLLEVARACGLRRAASAAMALRRFEERLGADKRQRRVTEQVRESLQTNDL